jgi:hypothetical protein
MPECIYMRSEYFFARFATDFSFIHQINMKPYRTSFMRLAAFFMLLLSVSFVANQAEAKCGSFTISTDDSTWGFSAAAGATQSRTLTITNTSGMELPLVITTGSDAFTVEHSSFTIPATGDSGQAGIAKITITFKPGLNALGNLLGTLTITKANTDCRTTLSLVGTVTVASGGDKVVVMDPGSYNFGTIAPGASACHTFYFVNKTGGSATVTSIAIADHHNNRIFTFEPAFTGNVTIEAGGTYKVNVCMSGTDAGEVNDSLLVTVEYGGAVHHIAATLSGLIKAVVNSDDIIVADPHEFTFGAVDANSSSCKNVVVTNKSKSIVVIRGWDLCDNKDFSVTPAFTGNDTLASGASMTFSICYTPHEAGLQASCNLTIKYLQLDPLADGHITVSFSGNSGNTIPDKICLRTEQGANFQDPIVDGSTAEHTLYLINKSNFAITVNSASITGDYANLFAITSTFPITVPANSTTTTLAYSFSPNSNALSGYKATVKLVLSGDSIQCEAATGVLVGYVVHSSNTSNDSVVRPLFPTEKRTLAIEGTASRVTWTFTFTNNLGVDATVKNVTVDDNTNFSIASTTPSPMPFVLHPGDNMTVVVNFNSTDNLVHHAHLLIDADHQLQSTSFDLQGLNNSAAKVSGNLPANVEINVSPNPASSFVTLSMNGVRSADVEVYDMLGKQVTSAKASSLWKWDASSITAGSYIVRISGESMNGENFVTSKRVVVTK